MQASTDDFLEIDTTAVLKRRLIRSYVRTAVCVGGLGLTAFLAFEAVAKKDAGTAFLALIVAIFTFFTLTGYTPRLLRRTGEYWPKSKIHDNAAKHARVVAAKNAIRTGETLGPDGFRMRRQLKILLISRLLAAVAMAMIWVAFTWHGQNTLRTAHFDRFGTYEGVSVYMHLDGSETITIDPSLSPGSYRQTHEQPPRVQPVAPMPLAPASAEGPAEVAPVATPAVDHTPIVPPNPPLPSYWPPITPGYSVTVYDRTPSGSLKLMEIRVQNADGTMYAVGP